MSSIGRRVNRRGRTQSFGFPGQVMRRTRRRRRTSFATRNRRAAGFVGKELKFVDTEINATAIANAWTSLQDNAKGCISSAGQGTGESQHGGRVQMIHSVHVKGILFNAQSVETFSIRDDVQIRVCVVLDTQTNASTVDATFVMDTGGAQETLAFRDLQQTHRFRILYDRTFILRPKVVAQGAIQTFAQNTSIVQFKMNKVFKVPIKVRYLDAGSTVASVTDNSISVIGVCNAQTNNPQISYQSRVRFTS